MKARTNNPVLKNKREHGRHIMPVCLASNAGYRMCVTWENKTLSYEDAMEQLERMLKSIRNSPPITVKFLDV